MPNDPRPGGNVIVISIVVLICFTMAACVAIFWAVPDGANTGSLIAILLATLPGNIGAIIGLVKMNDVKQDTSKIVNGHMDEKIRNSVRTVMAERWISDDGRKITPRHGE